MQNANLGNNEIEPVSNENQRQEQKDRRKNGHTCRQRKNKSLRLKDTKLKDLREINASIPQKRVFFEEFLTKLKMFGLKPNDITKKGKYTWHTSKVKANTQIGVDRQDGTNNPALLLATEVLYMWNCKSMPFLTLAGDGRRYVAIIHSILESDLATVGNM